MPITPPTCRVCGKQEWRHLCKGAAPLDIKAIERSARTAGTKKSKPKPKTKASKP